MNDANQVTAQFMGNGQVELSYKKTLKDSRGGIAHVIKTNIAKFKNDWAAQSYVNLINATGEYYIVCNTGS